MLAFLLCNLECTILKQALESFVHDCHECLPCAAGKLTGAAHSLPDTSKHEEGQERHNMLSTLIEKLSRTSLYRAVMHGVAARPVSCMAHSVSAVQLHERILDVSDEESC